jgi:dTDP-4-dehydrorhamnose reductase
VIDDQIGAPTDAAWLADLTAQVIAEQPSVIGIYHATAFGEVSWHGYASYLIAKAHAMGYPIKVSPNAILAVPSEAFPLPAKRPRNSRLDCSKLKATFRITPPHWQVGVDQLLEHLRT